ncbi:MAG: hypothetical protein ABSA76_13015 [Bacteroidales bacterium]
MKKLQRLSLVLALAMVIVSMIIISFQVQKTNVSGTWNMIVETGQGSGNPVIVLNQINDSVITGNYKGQFGVAPLKGIVHPGKISFQITTNDFTMEYIGTFDGTTMKGKVVFGSYGEGTFTGSKKVE